MPEEHVIPYLLHVSPTAVSSTRNRQEGRKSTGETPLDKIITGVQLIFHFHSIIHSALPQTLRICLFNQLEHSFMAGYTPPHSFCFCLAPSRSSAAQPSEGRGKANRQGEVGFPREQQRSHTGYNHSVIILEQVFTILNFSSHTILLPHRRTHRAKVDTFIMQS